MKRLARILTAAAALTITTAAPANAGSYSVVSCGAAPGNVNLSWTPQSTTGLIETGNSCTGGGDTDAVTDYRGALFVRDLTTNGGGGGSLPGFSSGHWRFDAPAGARITGLRYTRHLSTDQAPGWRVSTESDDGELEGCQQVVGEESCAAGSGAFNGLDSQDGYVNTHPQNTQWLRFGIRCLNSSCTGGGGSIHDARVVVSAATVYLREDTPPTAAPPSGAAITGNQISATVAGSDELGIAALELLVDGAPAAQTTFACDNRLTRPCAADGTSRSSQLTANISALPAGPHTAQTRALDAAGNLSTSAAVNFTVVRDQPTTPTTPPPTTPTTPPPTTPPTTPPVPQATLSAVKTSLVSSRRAVRAVGKSTCSSKIKIRVSGKSRRGKTQRRYGSVKPRSSGAWGQRVLRPAGVPRAGKLEVRITAVPKPGCRSVSPLVRILRK